MGVEVASLIVLHDLGNLSFLAGPGLAPATWGPWLARTAPADALASATRLLAFGLAAWLLGSTALYAAAAAARAPRLLRTARGATLPGIQRVVDRALAVSVAMSLLGAGVAFASGPGPSPTPVIVPAGGLPGLPLPAPTPAPLPRPTPTPLAAPATGAAPAQAPNRPPDATPAQSTHVVVAGDNLWTIAAAALAHRLGESPADLADARIARYWELLVAVNRPHLRSRNPDLIYPGETISLP